jgi:GNAT superfamily N-acetyltransferase
MQSSPQRRPTKGPVREATWSDSPDIAGLLGELGYPSSAPFVRDRLGKLASFAHSPVFVVEHDDKIVGFLSFHIIPLFHLDGGLGRITTLVVVPQHRGRGLGRALVEAAERFAWDQGCVRIEVTSADHRSDAHAFYEAVGYKMETRRFLKSCP